MGFPRVKWGLLDLHSRDGRDGQPLWGGCKEDLLRGGWGELDRVIALPASLFPREGMGRTRAQRRVSVPEAFTFCSQLQGTSD